MLTMIVMQHERGAVGGFSKEVVEENEDVLSCLRHLHRTLQECHWRVQSVDHALSAQGNKGLDGLQNQAGNDHGFQCQAGKDFSLQNQPGDHNLQDETGKNYSLRNEAGKDDNFQDGAKKKQNLEDQFGKISEQTKDNSVQDNPEEDHNHQNEIIEESKSEYLSWKDHCHQKPTQEKNSQQDVNREDESLPLQGEGNSLLDLYSDLKENLPSQPTKDIDLQKAATNDPTELHYPRPDHYIHNQTKDKESLLNNPKSTRDLDCTNSLHEKQLRGLIRWDAVDDDDAVPVNSRGTLSATVEPQHIFRDTIVSETSAVPYVMTDDIQHQLLGQNLKCSDKVTKEVSPENYSESSEVRFRPGHKEECLGSRVFNEGEADLFKNQKTSDASLEDQKEDKTTGGKRTVGKVSLVDTFPEVTQKMDVIWEALENLQSHFLALHSSIVDSSSHCCNRERNKSFKNSNITLLKGDKVTEPSDLYEHHARCEDEAGMLHQMTSKTTQLTQSFCEQPSYKKTQLRKLSQPVSRTVSRNYAISCTLHQQPASQASPGDRTAHRGTFFRGWQEGCLCIGMVLLLLLLLLFLASCLLLVLPVVNVSVRTADGLPAF